MAERGIVGVVGDHKVTYDEYRGALAYITDKYKTENQLRDLSSEDYAEIERQAWSFLVSELTWGRMLRDSKVKTSEQEILEIMKANPPEALRNNPELLNEKGEFDRDKYMSAMNNPKNRDFFVKYFRDLAEMLPKEKFRIDVVNSYRVTSAEANEAVRAANSTWRVTSLYFGPKLLAERAEPTEDSIKAYYRTHQHEFRTKEIRQARYVHFPFSVTAEDSAEAEEQIRNAYQQLKAGESFNLTMMDFSNLVAETTSGYVPRSRLDPKTDSVVKKLTAGRYSEPFLADYGWQIVTLDSLKGDSVALRRILVRIQMGAEAVAKVRDNVREFMEQCKVDGFDSTAKRKGLYVMRARPMVDRKPNLAGLELESPSQFVDWILSAKQGDIMPEPARGRNGFYVFELSEVRPAGVQKFEEAKEAAKWKLRQAAEKKVWLARAHEVLAEVRAGKTLEQVAAEDQNIELVTEEFNGLLDVRRRKGAEFAGAVKALEPGQHSGIVETNWGAFIIRCDSRQDGTVLAPEQYSQQRAQQVGQELIRDFLKEPEIKDYRDPFSY